MRPEQNCSKLYDENDDSWIFKIYMLAIFKVKVTFDANLMFHLKYFRSIGPISGNVLIIKHNINTYSIDSWRQ